MSGMKRQVKEVMERTGLTGEIGADNIFPTDAAALDALLPRLASTP
jgi:hypothetical protein